MQEAVDLVLNVFERTYRDALTPGAVERIEKMNSRRFARRVVLVNNVSDPADAVARAERLRDLGEIDEWHTVADGLERALEITGLTRRELDPLMHYSDFVLVSVTTPGSPWLLYWDPEAALQEPCNWVDRALELMSADERVLVANPSWEPRTADGRRPGLERETLEIRDGFALGPGFSDQLFLVRRERLARPVYRQRCMARLLYPGAHRAHVVEARLNAFMRHSGQLRATYLNATYVTETSGGTSRYLPQSPLEAVRYIRNAAILRALRLSPWRPRCLRNAWV